MKIIAQQSESTVVAEYQSPKEIGKQPIKVNVIS